MQAQKENGCSKGRIAAVEGIGLELRYEWNGELRVSQMFRSREELEAAAEDKRRELEARGWAFPVAG